MSRRCELGHRARAATQREPKPGQVGAGEIHGEAAVGTTKPFIV